MDMSHLQTCELGIHVLMCTALLCNTLSGRQVIYGVRHASFTTNSEVICKTPLGPLVSRGYASPVRRIQG